MNHSVTKTGKFGLSQTDLNWTFIGLVVPLLPAFIAGTVALTRQAVPIYGPLVLLAGAAVAFNILLVRWNVVKKDYYKTLKASLDTAWNLWTFLSVGTLLVSFAGGDKLETMLAKLTSGWVTSVFIAVCTMAAARFSLSLAELVLLRRPSQAHTLPAPSGTSAG